MTSSRPCVNCKRLLRPGDRFDMFVLVWRDAGSFVQTTVVRCSTAGDRPGCAVDTKAASA